jgi:hypothetical protein
MSEEISTTIQLCKNAKRAAPIVAALDGETVNRALLAMADAIVSATGDILTANAADIERARGTVSDVMIDRLALTEARINAMAEGIREISRLPSPLGNVLERTVRPNGLEIRKVSVPLGLVVLRLNPGFRDELLACKNPDEAKAVFDKHESVIRAMIKLENEVEAEKIAALARERGRFLPTSFATVTTRSLWVRTLGAHKPEAYTARQGQRAVWLGLPQEPPDGGGG